MSLQIESDSEWNPYAEHERTIASLRQELEEARAALVNLGVTPAEAKAGLMRVKKREQLIDTQAVTIELLRRELAHKQSQIDSLMLEYCPDEMTEEQIAEWSKHQVVSDANDSVHYEAQDSGQEANAVLTEQLALSQLREQQMRKALIYAQRSTCLAADDAPDSPIGKLYDVVSFAVEQPTDTSALEAMIQKAGEVMRERIIVEMRSPFASPSAIRALPLITLGDLK